LLPIVLCQDVISAWTYRRRWSAWNLKVLLPGSVVGVGAAWPQFSPRTLATSAVLLPFAVATNFLGLWLPRRTPTELHYRPTYLLMFLISLALIWQGASAIHAGVTAS